MRTSNKILLGTLLIILFILTAIHVALYAKYKSNDFITMSSLHHERYSSHDIRGVQTVSLTGLQNITIIQSDTARLEMEKTDNNRVQYHLVNGLLTIKGDTTVTRNGREPEREKAYQEILLYLPQVDNIKVDYCELTVQGSNQGSSGSMVMELTETTVHLGGRYRNDDTSVARFNKINVVKTKESSIDIGGRLVLNDMTLNLESSSFEDGDLTCDSLFISTDNTSSVKLSGKNIARTKFVPKP